jgi:phasin
MAKTNRGEGVGPARSGAKTGASKSSKRRQSKTGSTTRDKSVQAAKKKPARTKSKVANERSKPMNEQFTKQAQAMFEVAKDARIPEGFQTFAQDTVEKSREAYSKFNEATQNGVKAMEEVVIVSQAGAKTIGEKMMRNATANTEAAFDAAQAMTRARSLPELFRLQADFMQQQFAVASTQSKELFELSSKVAKQTFETMNAAGSKSLETFKK